MNVVTAIKIVSRSLILLGHNPITSFDDVGSGAKVANALYESSITALLSAHRWNFTKKKGRLSRLTIAPLNNWTYSYQLPSDMLNIIGTSDNSDYAIFGDKLYSNQNDVYIDYIFRPDESFFPPLFTETLEYYLASKFAVPITDSKTNAELYYSLFERQLKKAKSVDAQSVPASSLKNLGYLVTRL
jgi:hypothetical protein